MARRRGRRYPSGTWPEPSAPDLAVPGPHGVDDPEDGDADVTVALFSAQPADTGLYRREHEHDACGVAMVATMRGSAGHDIVDHALDALRNLDHRGATGADPLVGDGAGILTQVPDAFFRGRRSTPTCPPAGCVRRGHGLPARWTPTSAPTAERRIERDRRRGGPARAGLA